LLRRLLPYTTVLMFMAAAWTGWTLYSRKQSAAEAERQSKQKQAEVDRKLVAAFGGDQLTILGFNAAEKEISPGGRVLMCYGVSNATAVKIEPGIEPIKPALQHCLEVFPMKTTTYTLTASDDKGNTKSKVLTIRVRTPN
jgi:hypothetical protein